MGTKAGVIIRMIRLIKLLRIIKLYKHIHKFQEWREDILIMKNLSHALKKAKFIKPGRVGDIDDASVGDD